MKPVAPDVVDEIRRLNFVYFEDAESITAAAPCPTAAHRPEKVGSVYLVTFECPHSVSTNAFCRPCTADRIREGTYACLDRSLPWPEQKQCPGAVVVEVRTFTPVTRRKASA